MRKLLYFLQITPQTLYLGNISVSLTQRIW
jgi:hypothetical protein